MAAHPQSIKLRLIEYRSPKRVREIWRGCRAVRRHKLTHGFIFTKQSGSASRLDVYKVWRTKMSSRFSLHDTSPSQKGRPDRLRYDVAMTSNTTALVSCQADAVDLCLLWPTMCATTRMVLRDHSCKSRYASLRPIAGLLDV